MLTDKRTSDLIAGGPWAEGEGLKAIDISGGLPGRQERSAVRRRLLAGTVLPTSVTTELCT